MWPLNKKHWYADTSMKSKNFNTSPEFDMSLCVMITLSLSHERSDGSQGFQHLVQVTRLVNTRPRTKEVLFKSPKRFCVFGIYWYIQRFFFPLWCDMATLTTKKETDSEGFLLRLSPWTWPRTYVLISELSPHQDWVSPGSSYNGKAYKVLYQKSNKTSKKHLWAATWGYRGQSFPPCRLCSLSCPQRMVRQSALRKAQLLGWKQILGEKSKPWEV